MMNYFAKPSNVTVEIHEIMKYEDREDGKDIKYSGCIGFEVVTGEAATQIENESDGSCIDEYHEYLVLHFENGDTATFRNSHVDLFKF